MTVFQVSFAAHRYPDCPTSASLYSSVEARPNVCPINARTAKGVESHIASVGGLEARREGKVRTSVGGTYPDIIILRTSD